MCQLTLVDFKYQTKIPQLFLKTLLELNAIGMGITSNLDGFGFMTFKHKTITKCVENAVDYFAENETKFNKLTRNSNGIYHVRNSGTSITTVYKKDAHPFEYKNIILAHNGVLYENHILISDKELQKLFDNNMIDSEKFTKVLGAKSEDKLLNKQMIEDTINLFRGALCMFIYDKRRPNKVFVVKGKDRTLWRSIFYSNKEPIGMLINTGKAELYIVSNLIRRTMKDLNITVAMEELEEDSVYEYKLNSYELENPVKIEYKVITDHSKAVVKPWSGQSYSPEIAPASSDINWLTMSKLLVNMSLTLHEILILSEEMFGKSLYLFTDIDTIRFMKLLEILQATNHKNRQKAWLQLLNSKHLSRMEAYQTYNIQFPFMLNSKSKIKTCKLRGS